MILGPLWMHSEIKFLQAEKGLWEPHVEKCICGNCTLASSEELSNNIEWTLVLKIKSVLSTALMCNAIIATTSRKFGVRAGLCQVSFPVWWSGPPSSSFVLLRGFGLHSVLLNSVTFFFFFFDENNYISWHRWIQLNVEKRRTLIRTVNYSGKPAANGHPSPGEMHNNPSSRRPQSRPLSEPQTKLVQWW